MLDSLSEVTQKLEIVSCVLLSQAQIPGSATWDFVPLIAL